MASFIRKAYCVNIRLQQEVKSDVDDSKSKTGYKIHKAQLS